MASRLLAAGDPAMSPAMAPRIAILNPNTTLAFTQRLGESAEDIVAAGTIVVARSPGAGVPSVECHVDEALAIPGLLRLVQEEEALGTSAYVLACFGDTGIEAVREIAAGPVVGMTEAALFAASMLAAHFAVITLPPRTIVHAERVVRHIGLGHRCTVRAIDVNVDDCVELDETLLQAMLAASRKTIADDGAEAVVLGCAGLSALVAPMSVALGVPVIEGVSVAVIMAEGLVAARLRTSKIRSYGFPPRPPAAGEP
jgi:allantoin racemase